MSTLTACEAPKLISPSISAEDLNTIAKELYKISAREFLFRAEEIPDSNGEKISVGTEHRKNVGVEYKLYSYSRSTKQLTLINQLPIKDDQVNTGVKPSPASRGKTIAVLDYSGSPPDPTAQGSKTVPRNFGFGVVSVNPSRLCLPTTENRSSKISDELGTFLNLVGPKK